MITHITYCNDRMTMSAKNCHDMAIKQGWAAYLGQGNIIWPEEGKYKKGTKYENVKLHDPTN